MAWISVQAEVDVDVDLLEYIDRFTDNELCEEMRTRGYAVLKSDVPARSFGESLKERLVDAQAALMRRQTERAMVDLQNLIASYVPHDLLEAYDALKDGRVNDAIVRLDDAIEPRACTNDVLAVNLMRGAHA